jgi:phosphatidylserine/phosphatidylglycerophosphate/cardiolipin synthase-like enzyme
MATPEYSAQTLSLQPKTAKFANLTMDWFASKGMYPPRAGVEVIPLINGEKAFGTIYDAIEAAQESVDIISWGFDPAMRFKPGGDRIGELLDRCGRRGLKVRVLIWKNALANFKENTVIGDGALGSGGTSAGSGMTRGKAASDNGRRQLEFRLQVHRNELAKLRAGELPYYNDSQYRYRQREKELEATITQLEAELAALDEREGYNIIRGSGAPKQSPDEQAFTRDWFRRVHNGWMQNVEFRTRDFNDVVVISPNLMGGIVLWSERINILNRMLAGEAPDATWKQILLLSSFPSHHQKMVLIDYKDSRLATGFVMGHNMHRNYWDTSAHLFDDASAKRSPGFGPWQDLSTQVNGPLLHDLNHNFSRAWDRESHWIKRWFTDGLYREREAIKPQTFGTPGRSQVQICRTQPQEGAETSILEIYRKAIGNTRSYIYFENQYFRYAAFGEQLATLAQAYKQKQRPGDLHLFVVTNTPDSSDFSSSTYEMMQSLGQEQLMPQAQRDLAEKLVRKRNRLAVLEANQVGHHAQQMQINALRREIAELEAQGVTPEVEQRVGGLSEDQVRVLARDQARKGDEQKPYELKEIPGLKVAIATLTACSPEPGRTPQAGERTRYRNIYVHSKLLVVDDVFSLLSSANINTRSMHFDSELGLASPDPQLAKQWRKELWELHTADRSPDLANGLCNAAENFKKWNSVMDRNWEEQNRGKPLVAHLTRFWDVETPYATALD